MQRGKYAVEAGHPRPTGRHAGYSFSQPNGAKSPGRRPGLAYGMGTPAGVSPATELDSFTATASEQVAATGDEAVDLLGFDFGI